MNNIYNEYIAITNPAGTHTPAGRGLESEEQMTDKEIIIDGVDVSECSYYSSETYPYTCEVWDNECEAQNCYYKQLKRLEQENAELKAYMDVNEDFKTAWEELKAENERLQKLTCFNCGEETLSPSGAEIYDKILVYKQTLQEIKAIAEVGQDKYHNGLILAKPILDLITKAESEG